MCGELGSAEDAFFDHSGILPLGVPLLKREASTPFDGSYGCIVCGETRQATPLSPRVKSPNRHYAVYPVNFCPLLFCFELAAFEPPEGK